MEPVERNVPFEKELIEFETRRASAMAMGGERKLADRKAQGVLNARERIERLADADTFLESGMFATSRRPEDRHKSPADGKTAGYAKIDGRAAASPAEEQRRGTAPDAHLANERLTPLARYRIARRWSTTTG